MASSKTRSRNRSARATSTRTGTNGARARTTAQARTAPARSAAQAKRRPVVEVTPEPERPAGPPLWLQIVSLVLAVCGLGVSIYETYAELGAGSHLLGCSGGGTVDCTAVLTSPEAKVFGLIPVAILGIVFYVFVVAIMTPWAWQMQRRKVARIWVSSREIAWIRIGSMVVGIGFVLYLVYAELYQIGHICLYCTGVHVITFLLFCITVMSAALWGLGKAKPAS
jgi:uncharacterized membrane protein